MFKLLRILFLIKLYARIKIYEFFETLQGFNIGSTKRHLVSSMKYHCIRVTSQVFILSSRYKTLIKGVKNHANTDIKLFRSRPTLLDFFILFRNFAHDCRFIRMVIFTQLLVPFDVLSSEIALGLFSPLSNKFIYKKMQLSTL